MTTIPDKYLDLLQQKKAFASLATVMSDGSPQVTPVWIDREGDIIIVDGARSRQRTRNLKRDPRVALCIYDQDNAYSNVAIRGKAISITEKGGEEHIDKMNLKYNGNPKYPNHNPKDPRVLIRVEAKSIHEM
jgi:PPOX class probable F420-dependent enzyme